MAWRLRILWEMAIAIQEKRGRAAWVHAEELVRWIAEDREIDVIDVREPRAFGAGRVRGSRNLPDSNTAALVRSLSKERDTVLVCDDGHMSNHVARTLDFCGYHRVTYLAGGLEAWGAAGFDTESDRPYWAPSAEAPAERIKSLAESTVRLIVQVPKAVTGRLVTMALLGGLTVLALTVFWAVTRT